MGVPVVYGKSNGKIYAKGKTFSSRAAATKAGVAAKHLNAAGVPKGKARPGARKRRAR